MAVFTGYKYESDTRVFVIDLEDPSNKCKNLADVPVKVEGASGILFDSNPMFCGGFSDELEATCDCFTYEQSEWVSVVPMPTCRWYSGSAALVNQEDHQSRFVIAGGSNYSVLNKVEYYDGTSWHSLPNLPTPKEQHCLVAINETVLLSIGGSPLGNTTSFYNAELNQWLPGPELPAARYLASCTMVHWKNPVDGHLDQVIVVAGSRVTSSVDLLYINDISLGWQPGPELPLKVYGSVLIEY